MKVWCVPVNLPNQDEQPEQAEAARKFMSTLKGLHGICPHESGLALLAFSEKEDARSAKWKLEEFSTVKWVIIEGTITGDGKVLHLNRVLKE